MDLAPSSGETEFRHAIEQSPIADSDHLNAPSQSLNVGGTWRLVRTPDPVTGREAVAIMQAVDISRSDIDVAGLMIRCAESGLEPLIVLVRPSRLKAHPTVTIEHAASTVELTARVVPPGALLSLPVDVSSLAAGAGQAAPELKLTVTDDQGTMKGVVPLAGIGKALQALRSNCPSP